VAQQHQPKPTSSQQQDKKEQQQLSGTLDTVVDKARQPASQEALCQCKEDMKKKR